MMPSVMVPPPSPSVPPSPSWEPQAARPRLMPSASVAAPIRLPVVPIIGVLPFRISGVRRVWVGVLQGCSGSRGGSRDGERGRAGGWARRRGAREAVAELAHAGAAGAPCADRRGEAVEEDREDHHGDTAVEPERQVEGREALDDLAAEAGGADEAADHGHG